MNQSMPWMKFSHVEYLLAPNHIGLSLAARGALTLLMSHAARQQPYGSLPNDFDLIGRMVGKGWSNKLKAELFGSVFVLDGGRWTYPLMTDELDQQIDSCQTAVKILEKHIQQHFYQHLTSYLPSATVATVSINPKHQPDGFVMLPKVCSPIPVEVKLNLFNFKAERQLRRYMQEYNAPIGIAVAPRFYDESAADIIYIKIEKNEVHI